MKFYNKVQVLQDGETKLWFNDRLAASVGIASNVTLHGVLLKHCKDSAEDWVTDPSQMLVLSPFPVATWRNLIRASFTVAPKSGAILEILDNLERNSIFVGSSVLCVGSNHRLMLSG